MGSLVVLARLLTPGDFGLIAMVTAVTGFVALFKDMGLSMATVQKANINHAQVSTLFWINLAISAVIMALTAILAPAVAWFYREPCLTWITLAMAAAFIFGGLAIQHQALLRRQMRFGTLAVIEVVAMLVGAAMAVIFAWYGAGYWALVVMQLGIAITTAVGVWLVSGWRPGRPVRGSGVRPMLAFGGYLTAFSFVNYLGGSAPNVLLGRFWGDHVLGLYSKAYGLLLLPINQINGPASLVGMATLSGLQEAPAQYRRYFSKAVSLVLMFTMPMVAFLFVTADDVILAVLGNQWTGAVPIFRILGPAAFIGTTNIATGMVYMSLGNVRRQFLAGSVSSAIVVLGGMIGIRWGAAGVAASISIISCCIRLPQLLYCYQGTPVSIVNLLDVLWRPATASIAAGALLFFVNDSLPLADVNLVVRLFLSSFMYSLFFVLVWSLLPGGKMILLETLSLVKELKYKGQVA